MFTDKDSQEYMRHPTLNLVAAPRRQPRIESEYARTWEVVVRVGLMLVPDA